MKVSRWIRHYYAADAGAPSGAAGTESEAATHQGNESGFDDAFLQELGIDPSQLPKPATADGELNAKAEEDAEAAKEEEDEDENEPEADPLIAELPEATKAKVQRRINKLTARAKAAEESLSDATHERDEWKSKAEKSATPSAPSTPEDPLAGIHTVEDLKKTLARSEQIRDWALDNWDGGEVGGGEGEETRTLEAEQVRKLFKHHDAILRKHGPEREQALRTTEKFDAVARQAYPWIEQAESGERKLFDRVLTVFPGLKKSPDYALFLGDYVDGVKARFAREKAAKGKEPGKEVTKPTVKTVLKLAPKPPVGGSPAAPKTPPGQEKKALSLDKLAKSGGSEADLTAFFQTS